MNQSKIESLLETVSNTAIGFILSLILQIFIFPLYSINVPISTNVWLVFWFTILSVGRGYIVRRFFNSHYWIKFKLWLFIKLFKLERWFMLRKPDAISSSNCCCEHSKERGCKHG